MEPVISSAANPVIKRLRTLARRRTRQREGAAVVHGVQPVWQAAEAGVVLENLIVAQALLRSEPAVQFVADQQARGVRVTNVTGELFERLVEGERPSGLAAIIRTRLHDLEELVPATGRSTVVALEQVANPGNLGTIVRTSDATGVDGVVLIGSTADPFDPAAIKASMGALFNVRVARVPDLTTFLDWARRHELAVATTSAHGADPLWQTAYPDRIAVLMGNEGEGLSDETLRQGDLEIAIPMVGTAESLNLAVATGVVLYELWRSRSHQSREAETG